MAKINEVAEAAGVSISTVSYALSGKRPVSPATRKRIEDAVAKLGYSPNASARMLAGRRTNIFALTEPLRTDTHVPTHMAFVLATAVAARRHDYDILLLTEEQAVSGMKRVASSGLADAILVLDVAPDDERVALARSLATPTVFIGVPDDHEGLVCVDLDFEAAARTAVDKLAGLGHTRIGMIGMTETAYEKSNFPPRVRAAYEQRAAELGVQTFFCASGRTHTDRNGCRAAVAELLSAGITALVLHANEDAHTIVLSELDQRAVSVPYDLSLISVGNSFDIDTLARPIDALPLIPAESCNLAVELALYILDGGHRDHGLHLIAPTYLSRDSIGPWVGTTDDKPGALAAM